MLRLTLLLFIFIGTTLAGSAVIAALASGNDSVATILIAAAIGAVAGIPASWAVAKTLYSA
ncbi:MAG: hypothetical protein MRY81_05290 [Donghicola eburneus]|nr:hypothetical protein [Donghicola eburneus]MCI5039080.1 hypothetical protein [Donghicola eburneus]